MRKHLRQVVAHEERALTEVPGTLTPQSLARKYLRGRGVCVGVWKSVRAHTVRICTQKTGPQNCQMFSLLKEIV